MNETLRIVVDALDRLSLWSDVDTIDRMIFTVEPVAHYNEFMAFSPAEMAL